MQNAQQKGMEQIEKKLSPLGCIKHSKTIFFFLLSPFNS